MARDRESHVRKEGVLPAVPPTAKTSSSPPVSTTLPAPHPCLIEIVRLLAQQSARADIAAQRAQTSKD